MKESTPPTTTPGLDSD